MIIWESTLDNRYQCYVERTGENTGILTIFDGDIMLQSTEVEISYGASFGPDIMDIRLWQNMVIDYVDNR